MNEILQGMIAMAAYKALNQSDTRVRPLPRNIREACWLVFDPWWNENQVADMRYVARRL